MENDYYSNPAISNSKLTSLAKSPAHFKYMIEQGFSDSVSLEFGRAFHCALLEPDKFLSCYKVLPEVDRRTKVGKAEFNEFIEKNVGNCFIDREDQSKILSMAQKLLSSDAVRELLEGEYEKEFYWVDENTEVDCKAKLDIYKKGARIVDIKTTDNADPETFHRSVFKYAYHRQGAIYQDATGERVPYFIIAIEKDAPHEFSILKLSDEVLEYGRREYKSLLNKYAECLINNYWPGYEAKYFDSYEIDLPAYMK